MDKVKKPQRSSTASRRSADGLLTVREAADLLNVKPQQIYRQCELGHLPYLKVGRYMRFDREQLLAACQRGPKGESDGQEN